MTVVEPTVSTPTGGAPRSGLPAYTWCFTLALPLASFSGTWGLLGIPLGPDRILVAAGTLLLVLDPWAWRQGRPRLRTVHVLIMAVLAWTTLSALAHGTLTTSFGFFALVDRLVLPYLLLTLAPIVYSTPERRDLLLRTLVVLGLYLGTTALLEITAPALVLPSYITDPAVGIGYGRARGPFLASEADGLALASCGFASVLALMRLKGAWRLTAALTTALCAVGVLLTLTRSIWVGTVLGLVLAGAASPRLRRSLPLALVWLAVGTGAALVASPSLQRSVVQRAGTERSVYDRANVAAAAVRIVEEHPLTGVGWMRFVDVGPDYVRQADAYPITNIHIEVHNVLLGRAAELGLPGAALWLGTVVAGPGLAAFRRCRGDLAGWRLVLIASGACWFVTTLLSPVPYPLPNQLVFVFAGTALSTHLFSQSGRGSRSSLRDLDQT